MIEHDPGDEPPLRGRERPTRRPGSFFRGGELRGLVVFAVLVAIGWPIIINYARPRSAPDDTPKVIDPRPIEPDTGMAFEGLLDKSPMGFRDNAAYRILLERARSTPAAEVARVARRDVFYTQLWERPDLYRGVPIHLEGTLLKALVHEKMNPELTPKGRAVECWFITPESRPFPYVVMVEDPPPGLPIGIDLNERIAVDAYFLRLLGYRAGDAPRAAPLLVGHLRRTSPATAPINAGKARPTWTTPTTLVVIGLVLYLAFRLTTQLRRHLPTQPRRTAGLPAEEIDPATLGRWLADAADTPDTASPRSDRDREGHD